MGRRRLTEAQQFRAAATHAVLAAGIRGWRSERVTNGTAAATVTKDEDSGEIVIDFDDPEQTRVAPAELVERLRAHPMVSICTATTNTEGN